MCFVSDLSLLIRLGLQNCFGTLRGDDGDFNTAGVWVLLGLGIDHCCDDRE